MTARAEAESKLFVNFDFPSITTYRAQDMLQLLEGTDVGIKIGTEIAYEGWDQSITGAGANGRRLFVDTKASDLANTVTRSLSRILAQCPQLINMKADAGEAAMRAFIEARNKIQDAQIAEGLGSMAVAVTVLTSKTDEECMAEYGRTRQNQVLWYAQQAAICEFEAVTCSASDIPKLKEDKRTRNLKTVVLAVRPDWALADDQQNLATPAQAISAGADFIGVGRPINSPPINDSAWALESVLSEMEEAILLG